VLPALLLIACPAASALLLALAVRLQSLAATLLVAYLAFAANLGLTTLALSPIHEVTRAGLGVAEGVVLAGAIGVWWLRGRPGFPLEHARRGLRELVRDPATCLFLCLVVVLLVYELVLGLTVPPNNWDSLAYHLARAAAWFQHHGVEWIPNAPTPRMNVFQPLAEQELFYLFVAAGGGALYALPQFLAELAILVAVYGAARRLGFDLRPAACASFLVATFSLVALEATTAQNDLVAASFMAVAACLLLGGGLVEPMFGGAAAGFALGVKLSTAPAIPVLVVLALLRGRRAFARAAIGGLAGFVALGLWGYVLNFLHGGNILGAGAYTLEDRGSPAYPKSVVNALDLLYGSMDLSVLSNLLIFILAAVGVVVGVVVGLWLYRRVGGRSALGEAALTALPFAAPLLVLGGAGVVAFVARLWGFPIRGAGGWVPALDASLSAQYGRISNEDWSAFGPVGIVALLAAAVFAAVAFARGRADRRHLVLATALPVFVVLVALDSTFNPFLVRFFLVPGVVTAPLLAFLVRGRTSALAFFVAAALTVVLTVVDDQSKPLENPSGFGPPWHLTEVRAVYTNSRIEYAAALSAYDKLVPPKACVGAVLEDYDPSYLLYGNDLRHHVVYLPPNVPLEDAIRSNLFYVVVNDVEGPIVVPVFTSAGWRMRPLGTVWTLLSAPHAGAGNCGAN